MIARLDVALRQTLASDDVQSRLLTAGAIPVRSSPETFSKQISADLNQWKRVIHDSRLQLQT